MVLLAAGPGIRDTQVLYFLLIFFTCIIYSFSLKIANMIVLSANCTKS